MDGLLTTILTGGEKTQVPGEPTSLKKGALCKAASVLQNFAPVKHICEHVVGAHCYSGDVKRQVIAHHYCTEINEDFRQCLLYDSDEDYARLIGVEYMISAKLFRTLPEDEKKYWHSHHWEVKSGALHCPHVPKLAENEVMKDILNFYGKTIHLWQIDKGHQLPLGPPQMMMAITNDDIADWNLINLYDAKYNSIAQERREYRGSIQTPNKEEGADAWEKTGKAVVLEPKEVEMKK